MDEFVNDNLLSPVTKKKSLVVFFVELMKVLIVGAMAVVIIRYFLFQPFVVKGASMEPNYEESEYLIIDELSYRLVAPARGTVVVIRYPGDEREYFLKRIIGLPGERVQLVAGRVKIYNNIHPDGQFIDESRYLGATLLTAGDNDIKLGADEFFVMGDNRGASLDSRRFGPVKKSEVVGRALLRGYPFKRIGFLLQNNYAE